MKSKWFYCMGVLGMLTLIGGCETVEKANIVQKETVTGDVMEMETISETIMQETDSQELPVEVIEVEESEEMTEAIEVEKASYETAIRFIEEQGYIQLEGEKIENYYVKHDLDGYLIPTVNVPELPDGWLSIVIQDINSDGIEEMLFVTLEGGNNVILHLCIREGDTYKEMDSISVDFQPDAGRLSCDVFQHSVGDETSFFIEHQWSYDYIADGLVWDLYEVRVGEGRLMAEAHYNTSGSDINSSMTQYLDHDWEEITAIKGALTAYGFDIEDFWGHNRIVMQDQSVEKICSIIISNYVDYNEFLNFTESDSWQRVDGIEIEFINYIEQ